MQNISKYQEYKKMLINDYYSFLEKYNNKEFD